MPILLPAHNATTIEEYNEETNKAFLMNYWTRLSGTGTMVYNAARVSGQGKGGFDFSGISTYELVSTIPVNELHGLLGRFNHQQVSGAGTVAVGLAFYDANMALLGSRNTFFSGAAPAGISNIQSFAYLAGATNDTFISGSRFVKVRIAVSANTGIYTIDRPFFERMPVAQRALYV